MFSGTNLLFPVELMHEHSVLSRMPEKQITPHSIRSGDPIDPRRGGQGHSCPHPILRFALQWRFHRAGLRFLCKQGGLPLSHAMGGIHIDLSEVSLAIPPWGHEWQHPQLLLWDVGRGLRIHNKMDSLAVNDREPHNLPSFSKSISACKMFTSYQKTTYSFSDMR